MDNSCLSAAKRPRLTAEDLARAGVLRDVAKPEQACERARSLIRQGKYREAHAILQPHLRRTSGPTSTIVLELLGRCAMAGAGGSWKDLLTEAHDRRIEQGEEVAAASTNLRLAEMHLGTGDFATAECLLDAAAETFRRANNRTGRDEAAILRARLHLRLGEVSRARALLDDIVALPDRAPIPATELRARLTRALALTMAGDVPGARGEMLLVEDRFAAGVGRGDWVWARLMRGELLLRQGSANKATRSLMTLHDELGNGEDATVRALLLSLLGRASQNSDACAARRHLLLARQLYKALGQTYLIAESDIYLARVEARLSLDAETRLVALPPGVLNDWPVLKTALALTVLQLNDTCVPEGLIAQLERMRGEAQGRGDRSLAAEIDVALRAEGVPVENADLLIALAPELDLGASTVRSGVTMPSALDGDSGCKVGLRPTAVFSRLLGSSSVPRDLTPGLVRPQPKGIRLAG